MININVGVSKKIGLPEYSSVGADCHLSLELPYDLLDHPEELRRKIQGAYALVAAAVADELARQQGAPAGRPEPPPNGLPKPAPQPRAARPRKSEPPARVPFRDSGTLPITDKQLRAIRALVRSTGADLDDLLSAHGVHRLDELELKQASRLIDQLREIERERNGQDADS